MGGPGWEVVKTPSKEGNSKEKGGGGRIRGSRRNIDIVWLGVVTVKMWGGEGVLEYFSSFDKSCNDTIC